jgi:2-C-methyl-D-erythritol 4-phosphate cytidylyltransferase
MIHFSVIVTAAGSGTRFQSDAQKKTYALLSGKPLWQHSVERFAGRDDVGQIIVVVSPEDAEWFAEANQKQIERFNLSVVAGGAERFQSVQNALNQVDSDCEFVAIHDGARPCVSEALLERTFAVAREHGNAVPAIPVSSTLKRSSSGVTVDETVDRSNLFQSQTPQVFRVVELNEAYLSLGKNQPTDEAQLMENLGKQIFLAEGCSLNLKVTTQKDMLFANAALEALNMNAKPVHFDGPIRDTHIR